MVELVSTHADEPELQAERDYLAAARAALAEMHADVVTTETPQASHEDRDDVAENLYYRVARKERATALIDRGDVPLFFGRLDYEPGTVYDTGGTDVDRIYIGRRHVRDLHGTPLVIDWRAPISVPFYRASPDDPRQVRLRRRYGFSDGAQLSAFEDERLDLPGTHDAGSAILRAEIERPRTGPMRDIVATIQPEQDDLVRAPLQPSLCIQGAPGTGKTAVGLHRIAYLLYTERDGLNRGVRIIGPNRSFLSYIRNVLPALGEVNVTQATVDEMLPRVPTRDGEPPAVAHLKGDARIAKVLDRALWQQITVPSEGLLYSKGANRYRVPDYEVAEIVTSVRGSTRYGPGRHALAQRLAHAVLVRMERRGESPDDRVQNAVARSKPVKQIVDQVWPKLTAEQVLFRLLSDPGFLAEAAGADLTADEQALLQWDKPYRSAKSAKWTAADTFLLDELDDLIERCDSWSYVVVDEAQDLSPMQLRALGRRCRAGSATVLGDLAQATTPWSATSWTEVLDQLGMPSAQVAELDRGFRVPAQIISFAARLLPEIAPDLRTPTGIRHVADALRLTETPAETVPDAVGAACREALTGAGSVAVIAADTEIDAIHERLTADGLQPALLGQTEDALEASQLVCVPAYLANGLEFDTVIVVEPAHIVSAEERGAHRLYIALTRSVSNLHIIHAEPLPTALR